MTTNPFITMLNSLFTKMTTWATEFLDGPVGGILVFFGAIWLVWIAYKVIRKFTGQGQ